MNYRDHIGADARRALLSPLSVTCIVLGMLAAGFCWWGAATRGFEYDEVWTLRHYARSASVLQIFQDVQTPNNHPLYSLLMRYAEGANGRSELRARVPSLMAGLGLLVVLFPFFLQWTEDREVSLLAFAWCLLSAPMLHFAQAGRGYELQTFLVILFGLLLGLSRRRAGAEIWWLASSVVVGVAGLLTLPTSVLFLVPLAAHDLAWRILRFRRAGNSGGRSFLKSEGRAVLAYLILLGLGGNWLLYGFRQFAVARGAYGIPLTLGRDWIVFCARAGIELFGIWSMLLILSGLWLSRRSLQTISLAALICFPFLLAPLTRGGPSRVYLPLVPFGMMAASVGLGRLLDLLKTRVRGWRRESLVVVLALLPLAWLPPALRFWTPPDWRQVCLELNRTLPADVVINYPGQANYVIRCYFFPPIAQDVSRRVPAGDGFTLVEVNNTGHISALEPGSGHTIEIPVMPGYSVKTERILGVSLTYYRALRLGTGGQDGNGLWFAAIGLDTAVSVRRTIETMCGNSEPCRWGVLDGLLSEAFLPSGSDRPTVAALLVSTDPKLTPAEMEQQSAEARGELRFYRMQKAD